MRMLVLSTVLSLAAACTSSSPSSGQAATEGQTARPDASATCSGTCCAFPEPGTSCDVTEASTCAWAVTCPTGLVIARQVSCTDAGTWASTTDCPKEGENDARGCPASQPEDGAACAPSAAGQCGYVRACNGYRLSATASCNGQTWSTTPLGACD